MSKKSVFSYFVVAIPILFRSYMRMRKSERGKLTQWLTSSITGDTTICFVALFCFFCVCGKVHTVPYIPRLNKLIRINGIPENVPCSVYRMGKPKYAWILSVDKLNFWVMKTLQHKLNEDTNKKRQEIERGGVLLDYLLMQINVGFHHFRWHLVTLQILYKYWHIRVHTHAGCLSTTKSKWIISMEMYIDNRRFLVI